MWRRIEAKGSGLGGAGAFYCLGGWRGGGLGRLGGVLLLGETASTGVRGNLVGHFHCPLADGVMLGGGAQLVVESLGDSDLGLGRGS